MKDFEMSRSSAERHEDRAGRAGSAESYSHRLWSDSQPTQHSGDNIRFQAGGHDQASKHLPQVDFFDSKKEANSNSNLSLNRPSDKNDENKPSVDRDKQNVVSSRVETGKNFAEYSINKKTGETIQTNYDDSTKTTQTTGTDINGKTLFSRQDNPDSTKRRDYNETGYRDIELDKKSGTLTESNYNDKTKSIDFSVANINNGTIHRESIGHIDADTAVRRNYTGTGYVENSFDRKTGITTKRIYSDLTKTTDKIVNGKLIVNHDD